MSGEEAPRRPHLLERDRELAEIDACIADAAGGQGSSLVLEGHSGMGKSALLAETRRRTAAAGLMTCSAVGCELEGEFAFGVVRQLFEPAIAALSKLERSEVLGGVAALAEPVLDIGGESGARDQFAILHGLYWLAANLSARTPLLLAVDDAHWADSASLRWLTYLLNRLEGLSILVTIATRPPQSDPQHERLAPILAHARVRILQVGPLGQGSVAALVRTSLGAEPEPIFTAACLRATAGNPLGLNELLRALRSEGVAPTNQAAADLDRRAPDTIARRVLRDLTLLGDEGERLARALAVIGDGRELRLTARLAELEMGPAEDAADQLLAADLIAPERPPRFAHPLLRAAVYDGLPAGARQRLHRRAAEILRSEGAEPEAVAAHLMRCEAGGSVETVEWLRAAAPPALRRGAPEAAVSYLRRALAEDAGLAIRSATEAELGRAELAAGDGAAVAHLRDALSITTEPRRRAAILGDLALAVILQSDEGACRELLEQALDELHGSDLEAATRLECIARGLTPAGPGVRSSVESHYPRLRELARAGSPNPELARVVLAMLLSWRDGNRAEAVSWVGDGFDWNLLFDGRPLHTIIVTWSMLAILGIDELHRALGWCETVIREGAAEGYFTTLLTGTMLKATAELRLGHLAEAEADAVAAFEMSQQRSPYFVPSGGATLAEILFERGREQAAYETIESVRTAPGAEGGMMDALVCEVRGRLRCARGWQERGLDDLRASGRLCGLLGLRNPLIWRWRLSLAEGLAGKSRGEARRLAEEHLVDARRSGIPRAIAAALRTLAWIDQRDAVDLLREAVTAGERSPAPLELARALADLGAALRRQGHRVEARMPLLQALEIAARCGAVPLMERARAEAVAAGARPRRPHLRGVHSLTPSELRVARLAAEGRSNREIAQALFITAKTVADHLGSSYSKLDITSRQQLTTALELSTA